MIVFSYIDPSLISYLIQAGAGVIIAFGVVFGLVCRKLRRRAGKAIGRDENAGKKVEEKISIRV